MLNDLVRSISSLLLCNNSVTSIDNTQLSLYLGYKRKVSYSHYSHIQSYKCIRVLCSSGSLCSSSHVRPTPRLTKILTQILRYKSNPSHPSQGCGFIYLYICMSHADIERGAFTELCFTNYYFRTPVWKLLEAVRVFASSSPPIVNFVLTLFVFEPSHVYGVGPFTTPLTIAQHSSLSSATIMYGGEATMEE
jgi:hypothetical protein